MESSSVKEFLIPKNKDSICTTSIKQEKDVPEFTSTMEIEREIARIKSEPDSLSIDTPCSSSGSLSIIDNIKVEVRQDEVPDMWYMESEEAHFKVYKVNEETFNSTLAFHQQEHKKFAVEEYKKDKHNRRQEGVRKHQLKYTKSSEDELDKCNEITLPLLQHDNTNRDKELKCNKCDFRTINERKLNLHVLKHNNPGEVKKFKCDHCNYTSYRKVNVKCHQHVHRNRNNEVYKCSKCNFQTINKVSMNQHFLVH